MPLQVCEILSGDGVLVRGQGAIHAKDIFSFNEELIHCPESLRPSFYLMDFLAATEFNVSSSDVYCFVMQDEQIAPRMRKDLLIAFVAGQDVTFGMARMWQMLVERQTGWNIMVFRTLANAEEWLRLQLQLKFSYALPPLECHLNSGQS